MNTPEENAAYIMSQAACAMIEAMGMQAENHQRQHWGELPVYGASDFTALIEKYGIHHNAVVMSSNGA